jgi:hypothetical protein
MKSKENTAFLICWACTGAANHTAMAIKVIADDTVTSADPVNLRILVIPTQVVALSRGTPLILPLFCSQRQSIFENRIACRKSMRYQLHQTPKVAFGLKERPAC